MGIILEITVKYFSLGGEFFSLTILTRVSDT